MKITFISDTHTQHNKIKLPGGDILIHAGDFMNTGWYKKEFTDFLVWFEKQDYKYKIFIAGNHDVLFEINEKTIKTLLKSYDIIYLFDESIEIEGIKIYGSPWQPEFANWSFNLPRGSDELKEKWDNIPSDTDILITHGPPQGILDMSGNPWYEMNLGCELLRKKVDELNLKFHVFGHIHGSGGEHKFHNETLFINASVLNEQYKYYNKPQTFEWNIETNNLKKVPL